MSVPRYLDSTREHIKITDMICIYIYIYMYFYIYIYLYIIYTYDFLGSFTSISAVPFGCVETCLRSVAYPLT